MVLESTLDNYIYLYRKKQNTEAQARGRNFSLSVLKLSRSSNPVRSPHIVGDHRRPQVLQSPRQPSSWCIHGGDGEVLIDAVGGLKAVSSTRYVIIPSVHEF